MARNLTRMVALRYRDFRFLWLGEMVSTTGSQMQLFAINWHIFQLLRGQSFTVNVFGSEIIEMGSEAFGLGHARSGAGHPHRHVRLAGRCPG